MSEPNSLINPYVRSESVLTRKPQAQSEPKSIRRPEVLSESRYGEQETHHQQASQIRVETH